MRSISLIRFNALAGYCRRPENILFSEELGWFEETAERVLGVLFRDREDGDFGSVVLGRDRKGRFRAIHLGKFHPLAAQAEADLSASMERLAAAPDEEYYQGDERGSPVDFFLPLADRERLHRGFVKIAEDEGFSPARGIIEPMMRRYEDPDGNFVQQFQTDGFDARIWELYLFAAFVEMGYSVDRSRSAPDFVCQGMPGTFCVEATTVGPTRDQSGSIVSPPALDTPEGIRAFRNEYMPIKYGSALRSKLLKRYWEREHVAGRPLVFAIHDFQAPMSMLMSRSALPLYLYGYDEDWEHDAAGNLHIHPRKVENHRWGDKVVPSGFFDLPDAENVSAVLFSNSGTISRFDRMGVLAGFGSPRVRLVREGFVLDHDPNATEPKRFRKLVRPPNLCRDLGGGSRGLPQPSGYPPTRPRRDARCISPSPSPGRTYGEHRA